MWRILATGMFGLLVCNSSIFAASTRASDDDGGARFPYAANRARLSEPNVRFSQASGPGGNSPTNQVVTPTSSITVTAATYGGNCGVQAGNMTAVLAKACNGRDRCDYRIDYKIIGDPARGCHKDFIAAWQCSGDQASHTARVAPEAGFGSVITASCGSRPVLVPSSGATVLKNLEAQQTQQRQAECQNPGAIRDPAACVACGGGLVWDMDVCIAAICTDAAALASAPNTCAACGYTFVPAGQSGSPTNLCIGGNGLTSGTTFQPGSAPPQCANPSAIHDACSCNSCRGLVWHAGVCQQSQCSQAGALSKDPQACAACGFTYYPTNGRRKRRLVPGKYCREHEPRTYDLQRS